MHKLEGATKINYLEYYLYNTLEQQASVTMLYNAMNHLNDHLVCGTVWSLNEVEKEFVFSLLFVTSYCFL